MAEFFKKLVEWIIFLLGKKEEPVEIIDTPPADEPITESGETENTEMEEKHTIVVLIDNGHASSTPGKRSPVLSDGTQFFEYEFNRDVAHRISDKLTALGIEHYMLVPEVDTDIALSTRAQRANNICKKVGKENCLFISVHANASGNGTEWKNARGWSCYTSKGETKSDEFAEIFMKCAEELLPPLEQKVRKYSSNKYSWEDNFTVLVKTICPAVLTENLFYDNKKDLAFLQSDEGREVLAQLHVNAILEIEKSLAN